MILENSNGQKRSFEILFEYEKNKKVYIVYRDSISNNVYGGKVVRNKLKALNSDEYSLLNSIMERFSN